MLLMPLYMLVIGFAMGRVYSNLLVMCCYDVSTVIMLILVIVGSTIFSMEFQNGTIVNLMYHTNSRATVFFAKFLVLLLYDVLLHVVAMIITVLLNIVPLLNNPVSWTGIYKYHQPLVVNMFMHAGVDIISSALIISLICLMSCLINSNAIVIAVTPVHLHERRTVEQPADGPYWPVEDHSLESVQHDQPDQPVPQLRDLSPDHDAVDQPATGRHAVLHGALHADRLPNFPKEAFLMIKKAFAVTIWQTLF